MSPALAGPAYRSQARQSLPPTAPRRPYFLLPRLPATPARLRIVAARSRQRTSRAGTSAGSSWTAAEPAALAADLAIPQKDWKALALWRAHPQAQSPEAAPNAHLHRLQLACRPLPAAFSANRPSRAPCQSTKTEQTSSTHAQGLPLLPARAHAHAHAQAWP